MIARLRFHKLCLPVVMVGVLPAFAISNALAMPQQNSTAVPAMIESGTVHLSPENTRVEFVGTHVGDDPKPRLGGFRSFDGSIAVDPRTQSVSAVQVNFDIDSIWTEFDKLTGHLMTADFFDVKTFPTARFASTSVQVGDPGEITITGQLTLHGQTREIRFPARYEIRDGGLVLHSEFTLDRTEFGMDQMTDGVEAVVSLAVIVGQKTAPRSAGQNRNNPPAGDQEPLNQEMPETELVRLKLPNMHCAGCAASVRADLESVESISDIEFNVDEQTCQFRIVSRMEIQELLNRLAESNSRFDQWSREN